MKSGQFSVEFVIVLGVLLVLIASVTMPMYRSAEEDAQQVTRLAEAREAANKIASALNTVYSGGVGSKQTVEYRLPGRVLKILVRENIDGTDGVPLDNRADVQIWFNWEGDNVVVINTLLPSVYHESWAGYPLIRENSDNPLESGSGHHTVVVQYKRPDATHENMWIELKEV